MAAVGLLVFQLFWIIDFGVLILRTSTHRHDSLLFDGRKTLFLRCLSLFHGWLPFLLLFLVKRLRYERRALVVWDRHRLGFVPGLLLLYARARRNVAKPENTTKYELCFGLSRTQPQHWLASGLYLAVWMLFQSVFFYWPTHLLLSKWFPKENQGIIPPAQRNKG